MKILALPVVLVAAFMAAALPAAAQEHEHHHELTAEQLTELRAKIPLYSQYSDEEIAMGMSRMKNSWGWVGERPSGVRYGVLTLAHGFNEKGNEQFRAALGRAASSYPTTYAFGMAMMTSDHIKSAVSALEDAGVEAIIVIPTTTADNSTLVRQWDYIFGRGDESAYLDVPRVQSTVPLIWTETPTAHPIMAEILLDYAREKSRDPANETVIIMGHGPQSEADNEIELRILARHADYLKREGGFADVRFGNVQDDAPTEVRAANVEKIRGWATEAKEAGREVIVVTTALTDSGVVGRMKRDVEGVATFNDKGLMEHPLFGKWIDAVIAEHTGDG